MNPARYHRRGGPGVWYAALERAVWAEFLRHHEPAISPWEVRRRVGRARVEGLRALDLTNPAVRGAIGAEVEELVSDDLARCQQIAAWAQRAGYEGIFASSAALAGEVILAVFASALGKGWAQQVTEEHSRVQLPPPNGPTRSPHSPHLEGPSLDASTSQIAQLLGGHGARSAAGEPRLSSGVSSSSATRSSRARHRVDVMTRLRCHEQSGIQWIRAFGPRKSAPLNIVWQGCRWSHATTHARARSRRAVEGLKRDSIRQRPPVRRSAGGGIERI